jgi:hypothetical protein
MGFLKEILDNHRKRNYSQGEDSSFKDTIGKE